MEHAVVPVCLHSTCIDLNMITKTREMATGM